jgi:hypothetical protein
MFIEWAEQRHARRLRASECLGPVGDALTVRLGPADPAACSTSPPCPPGSVGRERDWDRLDDHVDHLLELARR